MYEKFVLGTSRPEAEPLHWQRSSHLPLFQLGVAWPGEHKHAALSLRFRPSWLYSNFSQWARSGRLATGSGPYVVVAGRIEAAAVEHLQMVYCCFCLVVDQLEMFEIL